MRDWALPLAILLVQVALFFRLPLFSADWLIPYDLPGYHLPLATHIVESLRAGRFPLWDNTTYCGFPFYANVQTQLFYPGAWPFFAAGWALGADRMLDILEWQVALHVWLGGAFAFALGRRALGASVPAALLGATVFQLGGFFASQAQHLGVVSTAAWLPWIWLAAVEGSTRRAAVGLAMAWLAGYPAAALVAGASGGLIAAWGGREAVVAYANGAAWAVALAAVQLLPAVELAMWAGARDKAAYTGTGGGVPLQAFISMVWPNYHQVFDPAAYKLPWNRSYLYLYCGLLPLGAALLGLARRRTPGWVRVGAAGFTLWMMGETTPLWRWVFPALPARELIIPELAIMAFTLTVAAAAVYGLRGLPDRIAWAAVAIAWADLSLAGSGTSLHAGRRADTPIVTPSSFEGSVETLRKLRELTGAKMTPPWRIDVLNDSTNWAASGPVHGIPMATGNDPLALARFKEVRRLFARGDAWMHYYTVDKPESPVLDLLNVRYLLHWETAPGAALPGHELRENADALPRFFLVNRTVTAGALDALDLRNEALVEGDSAAWENPGAARGTVTVELYGSSRVRLRVKVPEGGAFLVTSEAFYPGWQAEIDGQPHDLVLTNRAFRGLMLLPGEHVVTMRFRPWILVWGVAVSALTIGWGASRRA